MNMNRTATPTFPPKVATFHRIARLLMLAVAPAAVVLVTPALGATLTWDPLQNALGSDGSGNWDTTSPANTVWATGAADVLWPATGVTAIFGAGGAAGTVTIDDAAVSAAGLTFNATPGSDYTIAAATGNTLTLTAAAITVVAGQNPTISAPLAGTVGLTLNEGTNTGSLTLAGANTYTGTTTINSGTLIVATGGTLGAVTTPLVVGQSSTTDPSTSPVTSPAALILNSSATVGSLTSAVNNPTPSTITINGSSILTVNGAMTVGLTTAANVTLPSINFAISGNELDLNGNLTVGLNETGGRDLTTLNMGGLATFTMNAPTGAFNGGAATQANATITLAHNNTLTAASMTLSSTTANAGAVSMILGSGTNVLNISNITLGAGKGNAAVKFAAVNAGSIVINGTGGPSTVANITLSNFTSATPNNSQSNLTLATHQATVNAGTIIIGQLAGATGRTANGTITFDTGTFNAQALEIGLDTSGGGSSAIGAIGSFVLGTNAASTGVLTVSNTFWLGSVTNTSANTTFSTATFTINGGTANIATNILLNKGTGALTGSANSTLNLHAGTLNMSGFSIGSNIAPISNVNLVPNAADAAVLANLGGTGINGAGLSLNGAGTLTLDGTNTYTGTTSINAGVLQIGAGGSTGSFGAGDVVVNSGALLVNKTNTTLLNGNLTGGGNVTLQGGGTTVFAGPANTFSGKLLINNATLAATGSLGNITLNGGLIKPGTTATDGSIGAITASGLTVTAGELRFDLSGATSDQLNITGPANFANANLSVTIASAPTVGNYTLITTGGITGAVTLATPSIGRTSFSLDTTNPNNIVLDVTGGPASLVWNGLNSNIWDTQTSANFLNVATQDQFFTADNVTFNDANGGHYNVTITGQVTPGNILIDNSAGDYVFSGADAASGISGLGTLTKSGSGNLTLSSNNTRTGDTIVHGGNVTLAAGGVLNSGNLSVDSGASFTVASGGNITSIPNVLDNGVVTLNNPTRGFGSLNGSGTLTLNSTSLTVNNGGVFTGAITGSGALVISGAPFQIGDGINGSLAVPTTISAGSSLALNLNAPVTGALTGGGSLQILSAGNQVFSGQVTTTGATVLTNGSLQLAGANTDTLGTLSGSNNLIVGDGASATTLTLSGVSTFTGATTVNAGSTLVIPLSVQIPSTSAVNLNGGKITFGNNTSVNNFGTGTITAGAGSSTLQYTGANTGGLSNPIALNGDLLIDINDSNGATKNTFTDSAAISGAGNLTVRNSGTWNQDTFTLSSASNSLSGNLTVGGGGAGVRLEINNVGALGSASVTALDGSQFWINLAGTYANPVTFTGIGTPVDNPTFGGVRLNNGVNLTGPVTLSGDGLLTGGTNGANQVGLSGVISGAHTLTTESGVFTLSNANTYGPATAGTPGTIVARYNGTQSSTLVLGNANALGVGGLQLAGGGVELNGQSISLPNLSSTAGGAVVANTALVDTSAAGNGSSFLQVSSLTGIINGDFISGPGIPVNTYVTGTAAGTESPKANGTSGTSTITLASVVGVLPNDPIAATGIPTGTIVQSISGNVVTLSNALTAALSNATVTITTGNILTLNNALTADPSTAPLTILDGSVISNNGPAASATAATLTTGSDNSDQTFAGILVDGTSGGTLALVKNGSGMLALNGANTFTGGTTLNSGTLAGTGSLASVVTAGTAGHAINPGASGANSVGTLTLAGLTTNSHTTLAFDLASPTATNDLLAVTGSLTLAPGASLAITSQSVTDASSLGYYKVIQYGTLSGAASGILLPAVANHIAYTLDTLQDPGFIDIHRGFIGDANDDGKVDLTDLNAVLNNLGTATSSWSHGNFDGAATIDLTDLNDVLNNLGTSIAAGSAAPAIPTPEPASLALLGMGAAALIARRRKA
jgi:autotransporter-associated beta strand protein